MKILAVMGSPRKMGNTYRVVERVRENLLAQGGNIDFEYLFVKDCDLQMCTGCFTCVAKGEGFCPLQDDRDAIMAKITEADGIIFASPCFALGVPGIMKNFMDKFAYTLSCPLFFDAEKSIRKASAAFYRLLKSPARKIPGLGNWAYFYAFKTFTGIKSYRETCPADAAYYDDKDEYFYPLRGHIAHRTAGKIVKRLLRSGIKLFVKE